MGRVAMATHEDATLLIPSRFALGFMKSMDNRVLASEPNSSCILGDTAFGHVGMGGSIGFADPEAHMSFGCDMNRMGAGILLNDRGRASGRCGLHRARPAAPMRAASGRRSYLPSSPGGRPSAFRAASLWPGLHVARHEAYGGHQHGRVVGEAESGDDVGDEVDGHHEIGERGREASRARVSAFRGRARNTRRRRLPPRRGSCPPRAPSSSRSRHPPSSRSAP